jgi:hypothetical protein
MDGKRCEKCERDATVIVDGVHLCSRCALDSLDDPPAAGPRIPRPQPTSDRRITRSVLDHRATRAPSRA